MRSSRLAAFGLLFGGLIISAIAGAVPAWAAEKAAAMVIDANSGKVLHDNAGSELRHPASLTKMMTIYLAFETIEAGRLDFSTPIPISARAADAAPSKLGLDAGSQIPLRDAIKALIVKSANDMAIAIAEKIGGSEAAFAQLMTKRARQIGMERTVFRNASGLPDEEQVTTARDMLTLAMRLQDDFPQHYRMFSLTTFAYGGKTYRTHNSLLRRFDGVDGIKTGYTRASGFNLVSSYRGKNKHVVAAVFGGVSAGLRDAHMRMLLARAIEKASVTRTRRGGPQLVAEAKPAKRPATKPALPAAPVVSAPKAPTPAPAPSPAPQLAAADAVAADVPAETAATAKISIAKVKTVAVLPAAASDRTETAGTAFAAPIATAVTDPQPAARPAPAFAAASSTPRPDFAALKARLAAREAETPSAAERPAETPVAPAATVAVLADAPTDAAPETVSALPLQIGETLVPKLDGAVRPGRPPSTLQAQLASFSASPSHLGAQELSDTPALSGVVRASPIAAAPTASPAPAARSAGQGYDVQIGVYSTTADAERAMAAARAKAGGVLDRASPMALPLTKGDRQLYRARFAGFDSQSATTACHELRRIALDCFVAKSN